jgi:kinesin light chain
MSGKSEENRKFSQDEIISNTKNVVRGLETLKNEHSGILKNLGCEISNGETNVKSDILKTSLEKIELGIGEAQVFILLWDC